MSLPTLLERQIDQIAPVIDSVIEFLRQPQHLAAQDPQWARAILYLRRAQERFKTCTAQKTLHSISPRFVRGCAYTINYAFFNLEIFDFDKVDFGWVTDEKEKRPGWVRLTESQELEFRMSTIYNVKETDVLRVILHEMCHMLVIVLSWRDYEDLGRPVINHLIGPGGHGYHWQRLAKAVEQRAQELLHPDIDLLRAGSAIADYSKSSHRPTQPWFDELFEGGTGDDSPQRLKACADGQYDEFRERQLVGTGVEKSGEKNNEAGCCGIEYMTEANKRGLRVEQCVGERSP